MSETSRTRVGAGGALPVDGTGDRDAFPAGGAGGHDLLPADAAEERDAPPAGGARDRGHPPDGSLVDAAEPEDASLIVLSRREPEAFAAVFHRHAPDIKRYVTRRLGADAAEDVVADTFLAAFRQREGYDPAQPSARPWLYGIATNLIRRHKRVEVRQLRVLERTGVDPVTVPFTERSDERLSAGAARRRLAAALARLSASQRDVLLLVTWGGLTYPEAAQAMGIPVGTVRSRVNRARSKVREELGGVDPTSISEETFHG
ncbi:RNA polymerase sigma factor [Streptosporangium sp. NPDC048865]|uniref:RNA polymerase sigma factor n=1 Tax=Streptosporangium sp. NPDC048865 TaxID=3155766 RepID=UPI003441E35E